MSTVLTGALIVAGVLVVIAITGVFVAAGIDAAAHTKRRRLRADESRQFKPHGSNFSRPYYYDEPFTCIDCGVEDMWTAEDQQWYFEEMKGFFYATAKRCTKCRARQRQIAATRRRYEDLFHRPERTVEETLAMIDCSLDLIEHNELSLRQTQRVRGLLNSIPDADGDLPRVVRMRERVQAIQRNSRAAT